MYNTELPTRAELPTSRQLIRSTLMAAVAAGVLLTTAVLPAEYGIDPTGIGSVLRLTEMGKIKNKLAVEAAADAASAKAAAPASPQDPKVGTRNAAVVAPTAPAALAQTTPAVVTGAPQSQWRDTVPLTLKPGEGTEVKLKMTEGAKAQYAWVVEGGEVNYDAHGDGGSRSISYKKGRGASSDEGVLTAAFTGNHGWFWRNRGTADVKLILRTRGEYTEIKKMM
jgi:hypothetical protein